MSEQYQIINKEMTTIHSVAPWDTTIQVTFACLIPAPNVIPYFKIEIWLSDKKSEVIKISALDRDPDLTSISAYLLGHFSFRCDDSLDAKLMELTKRLNGIQSEDSALRSQEWLEFCDHVETWFNGKIRPILEKEEEMHRIFFETP